MRVPFFPILLVLVLGIVVDWYVYQRLRLARANRIYCIIYKAAAIVLTLGMGFVAFASKKDASEGQLSMLMWTMFTYFSFYIPKYIFAIFSLIQQALSRYMKRPLWGIAIAGAIISGVVFVFMWWGALFTRFTYEVREVKVEINNLPEAFRGYRIVQISDIHTGTFGDNPSYLKKVVDEINSLKPDLILFTGDIVNRHSSELEPFMSTLSELKAPDGVWSVMGNHDYGEYYQWNDEAARLNDVDRLKNMQSRMGWRMLNNDYAVIRRGNDSIVLIGVENIGDPPFTTYGDLKKAYPKLDDKSTKILMSHNPAHWTDSIENNRDVNVALTLSGHTHAMQMRIFGWSPSVLRYRTWGGLYTDDLGRSLYVNIGLGAVGFPARIGATPEITLITLTDK